MVDSYTNISFSVAAYQKNCALFDKSTEFGTRVDYHQRNIFGYGGSHKYTHDDHSNRFLMAAINILLMILIIITAQHLQ